MQTLQELIAPRYLVVYSSTWHEIGDLRSLKDQIASITNIEIDILTHGPSRLRSKPIAQLMSFASRRETTRPEDAAYCLLGLFDVNMPLLYGEGESKAFFRLQEQIMKTSTDLTILAWSPAISSFKLVASLANSPRDFQYSRNV